MEKLFSLRGKTAVVTAGGGVLCGVLARGLAGAGAQVAVLDLDADAAKAAADSITASGHIALPISCNALKKESLREAHDEVAARLGPVDILINGVGGNRKEATTAPDLSFFDLPPEALRFVLDVNLLAVILTTQVFARGMAERKHGVILNISSMNALRPLTRIPGYSAAKAALSNFTQWLAVHLCQNYSPKIRVNALAPGFFLTEQNRFLLTERESGELTPRGQSIIQHTPMGRFGAPEELVGAALWLTSDAASFVTGAVIPVDGGFSAFSGV